MMEAGTLERLNAELEEEQERLRYLRGLFQGESMPDKLDDALHMESVRFAGTLADRSARRLSALRRLALGGAGEERFCEDCGDPIPLSRILAAPECVCCRRCQAVREGDPAALAELED